MSVRFSRLSRWFKPRGHRPACRDRAPDLDPGGKARRTVPDVMAELGVNAQCNSADLIDGIRRWQGRGSAPDHLVYRSDVSHMIDPEILGTLISFAHPEDVPIIFESLVALRDEPQAVRMAASTLARQYLLRGFEHIGRRISEIPLWRDSDLADPDESA